jgi:hypothetical protein
MAVLKHRKFNADRFIDKFTGHEAVLVAHMARWPTLVPPNPLTPASFKDYLRAPHENDAAFEDMVEGLYQAYDFCTKQGHELLGEAIDIKQLQLPGIHDLPREVLALRLQIIDPETFSLACGLLFASQVDKFVTYKGREARPIPDVNAPLAAFRSALGERFKEHKGSDRIVVRHFTDGTAHNFIVYHERRVTAELEIAAGEAEAVVTTRKFRPVRQDFIAYYTDTGRLEIETPFEKERAMMRDTFALSFFGEADFFSGANAAVAIDLSVLKAADFALPTNEGHTALLKELTFKLAQTHGPTFHIRSTDVLATLGLNQLRPKLATAAEIRSAVISICFAEGKRPKRVTLTKKNSMSFSRATHAADTLAYLRRWLLLVD